MKLFSTLLSSVALLSTSALAAKFADKVTVGYGTIQGLYDSEKKTLEFTIETTQGGQPFGWFATGTGNQMAGSSMAIFWVNQDGSVTKSQRAAGGEYMPSSSLVTAQAFDFSTAVSNSTGTYVTWTEPMPSSYAPTNQQNFIWAHNPTNLPGTSDPNAVLKYHGPDNRGFYSLDLTKPYTGAVASSGQSTSSGTGAKQRDLSKMSNRVILVHVIFMSIAFLGVFPAGALIARYGRTYTSKWFPSHHYIQLFGAAMVVVGIGLSISYIQMTGQPHLTLTHEKLGIALFVLVVVQVILGEAAHVILHKKGIRTGYFHAALGVIIFGLSIWQMPMGLALWNWQPAYGASIFIYVWAGVIGVAYIAGFALLPRERRLAKERVFEKPSSDSDEALRTASL